MHAKSNSARKRFTNKIQEFEEKLKRNKRCLRTILTKISFKVDAVNGKLGILRNEDTSDVSRLCTVVEVLKYMPVCLANQLMISSHRHFIILVCT